jgi:hypothetical protein
MAAGGGVPVRVLRTRRVSSREGGGASSAAATYSLQRACLQDARRRVACNGVVSGDSWFLYLYEYLYTGTRNTRTSSSSFRRFVVRARPLRDLLIQTSAAPSSLMQCSAGLLRGCAEIRY